MRRGVWLIIAALFFVGWHAIAEITILEENGAYLELEDVLPDDETAVVLLYTAWDQTSINLRQDVEVMAGSYPDLELFFVDAVSESSEIYRQLAPGRIPAILVYDENGERAGPVFDSAYDLERFLKENDLLD